MPHNKHEPCRFCSGVGLLKDCRLPSDLVATINETYAVIRFASGRVSVVYRDRSGRCWRGATGMNLRFRPYGRRIQQRWISDPRRREIDLRGVKVERGTFYLSDRAWLKNENKRARDLGSSLTEILFLLGTVLADEGGTAKPHRIDAARDANDLIRHVLETGDMSPINTLHESIGKLAAAVTEQKQ